MRQIEHTVLLVSILIASRLIPVTYCTRLSASANADGPRNAALRKIDNIALNTEYNNKATSVAWYSKLLNRPTDIGY